MLEAYDLERKLEARREAQNREEGEYDEEDESALKKEFVENFLLGKDKDFDYSVIDNDESLDDLVTMTRDQQETFFDDDQEEHQEEAVERRGETGIQDY